MKKNIKLGYVPYDDIAAIGIFTGKSYDGRVIIIVVIATKSGCDYE